MTEYAPLPPESNRPPIEIRTFKTAPPFAQMLAEAKRGERTYPLDYYPEAVTPSGEWVIDPDRRESTTEGQALLNLVQFFDRAEQAALSKGDYPLLESIRAARHNAPFLGISDLLTASEGIADDWIDYLRDPAKKVFVYSPSGHASYKSTGFVARHILAFVNKKADESVKQRVIVIDDDSITQQLHGVNADDSRLVVVDDWMGEGDMIRADARQLATSLWRAGYGHFVDRIEANLLIVTNEQVGKQFGFLDARHQPHRLKLIAYYRADTVPNSLLPFGSHSSNDRNESRFKEFAVAIATQTGEVTQLPQLTSVHRPYRQM